MDPSKKFTKKPPLSSNKSTTPLGQWGFRQCLPFSWTTLRGRHCRHPIAIIGVVDTFGPCLTYGDAPALARVRLRESIAQTHHLASKIHRDPPPSPYSE